LGDKCGGNFTINDKGIKNCSQCMIPHVRDNYGYITGKYQEIAEVVREQIAKGKEDEE
jgi:Zn-finger protein